jgi:hypothetical protein
MSKRITSSKRTTRTAPADVRNPDHDRAVEALHLLLVSAERLAKQLGHELAGHVCAPSDEVHPCSSCEYLAASERISVLAAVADEEVAGNIRGGDDRVQALVPQLLGQVEQLIASAQS